MTSEAALEFGDARGLGVWSASNLSHARSAASKGFRMQARHLDMVAAMVSTCSYALLHGLHPHRLCRIVSAASSLPHVLPGLPVRQVLCP